MKASKDAINLIKRWEGSCQHTAYKDIGGTWTIGYGHTKDVKKGQVITEKKATELLQEDVAKFEKIVDKWTTQYNWSQHEFDALVSFCFNLGDVMKQLTANGTRSKQTIADKILLYNKCNGRYIQGLYNRRVEERQLFLQEDISTKAKTVIVTASNGLNLRVGPSTNNRKVTAVPKGTILELVEDGATWCKIKYRGQVLYAYRRYLA